MDLKKHIRQIPDFPKPGINFFDISTLIRHPEAWRTTIDRMAEIVRPWKPDLLAAIDDGHPLGTVSAKDIMTANPYSVRPETTLGTLVHVLRASDLVRVPVVDAKDKLVGIIARRDVLRTYLATGGKRQL